MITAVFTEQRSALNALFLEDLSGTPDPKSFSSTPEIPDLPPRCGPWLSTASLRRTWNVLLADAETPFLLFCPDAAGVRIDPRAPDRLLAVVEAGVGMAYADYAEATGERIQEHPLNDYQMGSLRDGFDFGPLILLSRAAARRAIRKYGEMPAYRWAGWYDLRLKISADHDLFHLPEWLSLIEAFPEEAGTAGSAHFTYVDPRNRPLQEEMEAATPISSGSGPGSPLNFVMCRPHEPFPWSGVVIPVRTGSGP
jgi:hypothetical protein